MPTPFELSRRRVVVTGASSGIGRAIAVAFGRAGARVAGISLDGGAPVEDGIFVTGDTGASEAVEDLARVVVEQWGGIDVWVNNAARLLVKPLIETTDDDWHGLLRANLHGYFYGCRAAARRMLEQGSGRIVNVTSATNVLAVPELAAYGTAKGGILALTKAIAVELAPAGITVNCVAPGPVDTPLNTRAWTPEVRRTYEERIPLGHIASAGEVADVVLFLASDAARYVTGQEVIVDGGFSVNGAVGHARG